MEASKTSVEEVLDAIADCILQCVMFSAEAEEEGARMSGADLSVLTESIDFLADLAMQKAKLWAEFSEDYQKQMEEGAEQVKASAHTMKAIIDEISTGTISRANRASLLRNAKSLMQTTVFLLQIADLYDIRHIIKLCKDVKELNEQCATISSVADLPPLVSDFIFKSTSLAKTVQVRVEYIVDPIMKKKLAEPNRVVLEAPEPMIHETAKVIMNQGEVQKHAQNRAKLCAAIRLSCDQIMLITKETSQTLFSGLDLDIPLDDEDADALPEDMRRAAAAEAALLEAKAAVVAGNEAAANEAMALLAGAMDDLDDGTGGNMADAARKLADSVKGMFDTNHEDLIAEADAALASATMGGVDAAQAQMEALEAAAKAADAAKSEEAAKLLLASLESIEEEDESRSIAGAAIGLSKTLQDLFVTSQAFGRGEMSQEEFERTVAIARADLDAHQASLDPLDGKYDMHTSVRMAGARVAMAADGIFREFDSGPRAVAAQLRALNSAVSQQAQLAAHLAAADPAKREELGALDEKLRSAVRAVIEAAKVHLTNPTDESREQLERALDGLGVASEAISIALYAPEERALDVHARLLTELEEIKPVLKATSHVQVVERDLRRKHINDAVKQQLLIAKEVIPELENKAGAIQASKAVAAALASYTKAADHLAANPDDPEAYAAYVAAEQDLLSAADTMTSALSDRDMQQALVDNAGDLYGICSTVQAAVGTGKECDAQAAALVGTRLATKQAILARIQANRVEGSKPEEAIRLRKVADDIDELLVGFGEEVERGVRERGAAEEKVKERVTRLKSVAGDAGLDGMDCEALEDEVNRLVHTLCKRIDDIGEVDGSKVHAMGEIAATHALLNAVAAKLNATDDVIERRVKVKAVLAVSEKALEKLQRQNHILAQGGDGEVAGMQAEQLAHVKATAKMLQAQAARSDAESLAIRGATRLAEDVSVLDKQVGNEKVKVKVKLVNRVKGNAEMQADQARAVAGRAKVDETRDDLLRRAQALEDAARQVDGAIAKAEQGDGRAWEATREQLCGAADGIVVSSQRVASGETPAMLVAQADLSGVKTLDGAAKALEKRSGDWVEDDTPRGQLVVVSKEVSTLLRRMVAAAEAADKKEMVACAREISANTGPIVGMAREIAASSNDPDLQNLVVSNALAVKNFGVQLKILGAVKASTSGKDRTAESQLVTCAKGLVSNLINAISTAEVIALKK